MNEFLNKWAKGDPTSLVSAKNFSSFELLTAMANSNWIDINSQLQAKELLLKVKNKIPMDLDLEVDKLILGRLINAAFGE